VKAKFFILAVAAALASAGGLMYYLSTQPVVVNQPIISSEPRHLVTPEMTKFTDGRALKVASAFERTDPFGKQVTIADTTSGRPQFVYFIKDGCPCSIEVEPLFHDLSKRFGDKIDFIGVIDKKDEIARRWHTEMLMPYTVVADPSLEIIKAYGATNSAFSALVSRGGKIVKMWPGYSIGFIKEMNAMMASETGQKAMKIDTKWAPKKAASGCRFDEDDVKA